MADPLALIRLSCDSLMVAASPALPAEGHPGVEGPRAVTQTSQRQGQPPPCPTRPRVGKQTSNART